MIEKAQTHTDNMCHFLQLQFFELWIEKVNTTCCTVHSDVSIIPSLYQYLGLCCADKCFPYMIPQNMQRTILS